MSLLDKILEVTNGPTIVSEQHDTSKIDWRAGVADANEMIKLSGERGEQGGINAGLRRAGLDTSTGRVALVVAGKLPWHKLGVQMSDVFDWRTACELGGLNWEVKKQSIFTQWQDRQKEVKGTFALVRQDTGKVFGTCAKFQPIQNRECFTFLDEVLREHGAHYEVAGSLYDGEQVFAVARMPKQTFTVNGNDRQDAYAVISNSHVVGTALKVFPTSVRAECANTLRLATSRDSGRGITIAHTGDIRSKIRAAQDALGIAVDQFTEYKSACEQMTQTRCDVRSFANNVLDKVLEITDEQSALGGDVLAIAMAKTIADRDSLAKKFSKQIERRQDILADILDRYETQKNTSAERGTTWAAFNAVTDHADHSKSGRQASDPTVRQSRVFESALTGDADEIKQVAFVQAVAVR